MMRIIEKNVGNIQGRPCCLYTIKNDFGDEVDILDFGLILHAWRARTQHGQHDILLGYENIQDYGQNEANFGCIVGRYANRIAFGKFSLKGQEFQLPCNLGKHHLHGGPEGLGKKHWSLVSKSINADYAELEFYYRSLHGDQGYPGNVDINVSIRFTQNNEVAIRHRAITDEDTPLNLTNHAYFNLGTSSTVLHHFLEIKSDSYTETDPDLIPTGKMLPVMGTPYDFTTLRPIHWVDRDDFLWLKPTNGYDVNYVVRNSVGLQPVVAAVVHEKNHDITLEVRTNKPGLQLYTGNWLEGILGKKGKIYKAHGGFCLEAQDFPDAPNHPGFPSAILKVGESYFHEIIYTIKKGGN